MRALLPDPIAFTRILRWVQWGLPVRNPVLVIGKDFHPLVVRSEVGLPVVILVHDKVVLPVLGAASSLR